MALQLDPRDDDELSFAADNDVTPPAAAAHARPLFQAAPAEPLPATLTVIPASRADRGRGDQRQGGDRRQTDRRGMDQLRADALRNIISNVEDRNFSGLRNKRISISGPRIPMSRLLLLGVALLAGGVAAFLAIHRDEPVPAATVPVEVVKPAPATQILVAKTTIGAGQRLAPALLEWQDWPEATLRPEYITIAAAPDAMTSMASSIARGEFFPGEPIRAQKLTDAGHGFLAAILDSGMRGVSVQVAADAASGGFVVPNDHVDVVLTRQSDSQQVSQTILTNVRILAINARLGNTAALDGDAGADASPDPATEVFTNTAIATLELNPAQAETIINATTAGRLSLMLRPTVDNDDTTATAERAANAAIRMSSPFWAK